MRLPAIQLLLCARLIFTIPQLHSQTTAPHPSAPDAPHATSASGSWHVLYEENFEGPAPLSKAAPAWAPDTHQTDDEFSDGGSFFTAKGIKPPTAYRIEAPFGQNNWLTVAAYSRSNSTKLGDLFAVVLDPANPANHVLRVASPQNTDGLVIRNTVKLPAQYRVCVRAGYADFGDGKGRNGYLGPETDEPWDHDSDTLENGFYWLTILDAVPRPHNNIWIHHHRKVNMDSDNNTDNWTNIWEGHSWVADGSHPIMMFALDKNGEDDDLTGRPFLAWSHGALQPSGQIRAVDAYKDKTWYTACIERNATSYVLSISGDFKFGGQQTYTGAFPLSAVYAATPSIPDFFMFGDPHNNFYRGSIYYDDIKLEVPASEKPTTK